MPSALPVAGPLVALLLPPASLPLADMGTVPAWLAGRVGPKAAAAAPVSTGEVYVCVPVISYWSMSVFGGEARGGYVSLSIYVRCSGEAVVFVVFLASRAPLAVPSVGLCTLYTVYIQGWRWLLDGAVHDSLIRPRKLCLQTTQSQFLDQAHAQILISSFVVRRTNVGCADQKYFIRYSTRQVCALPLLLARSFSLITRTRRLLRPNSRQNSTPRAISLSAVSRPAMIATKRRPDPRYPAEPRS